MEEYFDTHDGLEQEEQEEQVQQENTINSSLLLGTKLLDNNASYLLDVSGDSLLLGDAESLLTPPVSATRIHDNTNTNTGGLVVGDGASTATASTTDTPNQGADTVESNHRDSSNDHDDNIQPQKTPQEQHQEGTVNPVSEPVTATPAATAMASRSRSIVTGQLLSPFSPLLKQQQQQRANAISSTIIGDVAFASDDDLSLQPCRKISTIAHICYHSNVATVDTNDTNTINMNSPSVFTFDDEATNATNTTATSDKRSPTKRHAVPREKRLCLFPMMLEDSTFSTSNTDYASPTTAVPNNSTSCLSPTSATLHLASTQNTRDLVVVNPSAFGKYIPSEVTMHTAKLVAQVANIESEDWARTYRFQQVIWPTAVSSTTNDAQKNKKMPTAFSNLARAIANDLVVTEPNSTNSRGKTNINKGTHKYADASRLIVGTGSAKERISTLFGKPFSGRISPDTVVGEDTVFHEYGLIGATMNGIFRQLPPFSVCTVSAYEIVDEDVLHDLLAPVSPQLQSNSSRKHPTLHVRQPRDQRGAIIEGLTECPVDSVKSLRECLQPLHSTPKSKASKKALFGSNSSHHSSCQGGHTIVAVKIYQNGMEDELHHNNRCATLTFVNLALPSSSPTNRSHLDQQKSDRQTSFLRTSASTLGRILRGLLAREAGVKAIINYRESILTKVLQRQLEQPRSRVVMLASLSPLSDAYDGTLATLRYMERLLARPGLPKSPYGRILPSPSKGRPSPDKGASCPSPHATSPSLEPQILMEQFADKESILKSVITDPRQRLARFYRTQKESNSSDNDLDESNENDDIDLQSWSFPRTPVNDQKVIIGSDDLSGIEDQSTVQEMDSQLPILSDGIDDNLRRSSKKDHNRLNGQSSNVNMPETVYMSDVDPERFHPSRTDFSREVAKLESSVNRMMKDRNFAIWQSSSISIRYLKDFHFSQQQAMNELQQSIHELISQRDKALLAEKEAEEKQLKLLRDYNELSLAKDSELASMMETVKLAESDRADVEKIAEEAIAAQDTLEHAATELEQKLIHNQKISKATQFELESLAAAKEEASEKLHQSKEEIFALKSGLNEMKVSVAELQVALKQAQKQNEFMANRHAEDQDLLAELDGVARVSSQERIEQAKRDKQFKALETENMLLARKFEAQSLEFSKALEAKEKALLKCRADLVKVREQLGMLQNQDECAAKSMESSMNDLHSEVVDLRNMLAEEQQTKEDALVQQKNCTRLNKEISDELESTRKELEQRILDVQELSVGLKQAIEEKDSLKLELCNQEEALRGFQLQTRQKIHHVEKYKGAAATQLEEALDKNEMLMEVNEKLQLTMSQLQKERDEALRFARDKRDTSMIPRKQERKLQEVNKQLQLTVSQLQEERDEALRVTRDKNDARSILLPQERNRKVDNASDEREALRPERESSRNAFEEEKLELQERVDRTKELLELFVKMKNSENLSATHGGGGVDDGDDESKPDERTRSSTYTRDSDFYLSEAKTSDTGLWSFSHDQHRMYRTELAAATSANKSIQGGFEFATPRLSVRAEEIAACMALSARQSFNLNIEPDQEQDLTISALRRKVKLLENALVFRGEQR